MPQVSSMLYNQYIAAMDFFPTHELNQLYLDRGAQMLPFANVLASMGRSEMLSSSQWDVWTMEDWDAPSLTVAGAGIPAGVNTFVLTLGAADVDANGLTYLRETDVLLLPNGENCRVRRGTLVTGANTATCNVDLIVTTNTTGAGYPAGTRLAIFHDAHASGTAAKAPAISEVSKVTYYTQIIKERIGADGGVLADSTLLEEVEDGRGFQGYLNLMAFGLEYRLAMRRDASYFIGQAGDPAAFLTELGAAGQQNPILTSAGLFPTAAANGTTLNWGGVAWTAAYFDTIERALIREGVTAPYIFGVQGLTLTNAQQEFLRNANQNTGIDFTKMTRNVFNGNEELAMQVNFATYTRGQFTYCWWTNNNFSNPNTFGAPGYTYESRGVYMPITKYADPSTSGGVVNNFHIRYKGLGQYSRRMVLGTISGAGETNLYLSSVDASNTYAMCEEGMGFVKPNQFINVDI